MDIPITIDQAASVQSKIAAVGSELDRTEKAGQRAAVAIKAAVADGSIHWTKAAEAQKQLTAEIIKSEQAAARLAASTRGGMGGFLDSINGSIGGITKFVGEMGLAAGAVMGFASGMAGAMQSLAGFMAGTAMANDGLIQMRNQLRNVTKGNDELARAMTMTMNIANRTNSDVGTTRDAYARMAAVTNQLGFGLDRTGRFTETLAKMMGASGRSAGETSSALLQFSQALGSGVLQGDEFKSLAENMPQLLEVFANQLGVTRGALKQMASDGKITTDVMIKGIESMATRADIAFAQMEKTYASRVVPLANQMKEDPLLAPRMLNEAGDRGLGSLSALASTDPEINPAVQISRATGWLQQFNGPLKALHDELDTGAPKVSEENQQLGEFALKMERLAKLMGGGVKPEIKSMNDQIAAQLDTIKSWKEAMDPANKALGEMQAKANAAKNALRALGNSNDLSSAILSAVVGSDVVASKDKAGNMIARPGGSLFFNADWKGAGLEAKIEKELELYEKSKAAWIAFEESINGGARNFNRHVAMMDGMLKSGRITVDQYTDSLRKLIDGLSDFDKARTPKAATHSVMGAPGFGPQTGLQAQLNGGDPSSRTLRPFNENTLATMPIDFEAKAQANIDAWFKIKDAELDAVEGLHDYNKALERNKKMWGEIENQIRPVEDAFNRLFETGKFGAQRMFDEIMRGLQRMATHQLFARLLGFGAGLTAPDSQTAALSSNTSVGDSAPGNFFGAGGFGGGFATGGTDIYRAATGASYMIGGRGGLDSVPFPLAMVSPGERVDVIPRSQAANGNRGGGGTVINAKVIYQEDKRALLDLLDTPDGHQVVARVMAKTRRRLG